MGNVRQTGEGVNPQTERAQTPVEVVALALDRYAELDEFQSLEDYVLKALSEAGWRIVQTESIPAWDEDGFARIVKEFQP